MLHLLLESSAPLGAADLAERMQLTPRQVNYGLKGLRSWLAQRNVNLEVTPGVGAGLACSPDQQRALERELTAEANFQLVLSVEQRQQLIALILLVANEPLILYQLQQLAQVSRTTILKDLDAVESWIQSLDLKLERRQNYGVWIQGSEKLQRQALAAFLWGQTSLGQPLTAMTHTQGLVFELDSDAGLLPIVEQANKIIRGWDTTRTFGQVTYAEDQLGGRFTDDAVLYLAMVLAIQTERVKSGKVVDLPELLWSWLRDLEVWATAV
jgi:mannitol operon transcriptional antiterminator